MSSDTEFTERKILVATNAGGNHDCHKELWLV